MHKLKRFPMHSAELRTAALLAGQDLDITFHVLPALRVTVQVLKAYDQATAHKNVSEQIQAIRRYYKGPFWIDYEYLTTTGGLAYENIFVVQTTPNYENN